MGGKERQGVTRMDDGVEAALEVEDAIVEDHLDVLGQKLGVDTDFVFER